MNENLSNYRIASLAFRRALLLGLIGALVMGIVVVNAVSSTNLGDTNLKLANESFSSDPDVAVLANGVQIGNDDSAVGTTQATATEMESGGAGKYANPFLTKDNYVYSILVQEAANASFQSGEVYKIEIWGGDGTGTTLLATVYCQQSSVDDGVKEGCEARADQGSASTVLDTFNVIVTQVAP